MIKNYNDLYQIYLKYKNEINNITFDLCPLYYLNYIYNHQYKLIVSDKIAKLVDIKKQNEFVINHNELALILNSVISLIKEDSLNINETITISNDSAFIKINDLEYLKDEGKSHE